jgi:hypothetical protein
MFKLVRRSWIYCDRSSIQLVVVAVGNTESGSFSKLMKKVSAKCVYRSYTSTAVTAWTKEMDALNLKKFSFLFSENLCGNFVRGITVTSL